MRAVSQTGEMQAWTPPRVPLLDGVPLERLKPHLHHRMVHGVSQALQGDE